MKRILTLFVCSVFFISCATTHPGRVGTKISATKNLDLSISSKQNRSYSDASNIYLDLTIENKSGNWAHVNRIETEFLDPENNPHNVIVGPDLEAWAQSLAIRKSKEEHNADLGVAGLLLAGTALMVAAASGGRGGNAGLAGVGAAAVVTAVGVDAGREIQARKSNVENAKMVPESHLYAPFSIPSNGFAQKWLIVNVPKKRYASIMRLKFFTAEGEEGVYDVSMQ